MTNSERYRLIKPSEREFTLTRSFDAPRQLVFDAFTRPQSVKRWLYGPEDWPLAVCEVDLRVGGKLRYVWRHKDKGDMGLSGVFHEVEAPARLVHTELFDQDWTGGETILTTTFEERAGRTTVASTVRYSSQAARDGALATGMIEGWAKCHDRLADLLPAMIANADNPQGETRMQEQSQGSAKVQPYLFFDGRCEEAIEFYKKTLGAQVEVMMRFKQSPDPHPGMCAPGNEDKIMHSCFRIGNTQIMASDGRAQGKPVFRGFALSVSAKDDADADRMFNALADGGQVQMPMGKTFFSPRFGMVADRFGMGWMVIALPPETTGSEFVISRVFDAPRELVWKCFTDPEHMKQWWGPKGFKVIASKMDLRPGGTYHYGMKAPDGSPMWGKFIYREIVPREKLVFVSSFSDESGSTTRHPLNKAWPLQMLSVFTFEDQPGGKTKFTVRWAPLNATEDERKTFDAGHGSMNQGWSGTMEQLADYLAKAKA